MALTATATQGFELLRYTCENEVMYVPGDPGDTITQGDQLVATVGEGILDVLAANEGGAIGRAAKTVVMPSAATAFPFPTAGSNDGGFDYAAVPSGENLTLVPITVNIPSGIPVYKVTFASHWDDTVTSWTEATRALAVGTGMSADDYPNGALIYIYAGTGIGQVNVIEDYVHGTLTLTTHRAWHTAPDSTSKVIVIGGEAATNRGIGFFNRCESDNNNLVVNQGADDGDYVVYLDFRRAADYLKNLTLPVIPARYLLLA